MAVGMSTTLRNDRLQKIIDAVDGGSGAGVLKIYTATRPATGAAITSQTLLGTLTFSDPSAPAPSGGVLNFSSITSDTNADATGVAAWARIETSAGTFVMDLSVGAAGSGSDIELFDVNIVAGQTISITQARITEGNA